MSPNTTSNIKDRIQRLIDRLPAEELRAAERFLRFLHREQLPEVLRNAPEEKEPISAEERAAIEEGEEAHREGDVLSHEEVKRQLGR